MKNINILLLFLCITYQPLSHMMQAESLCIRRIGRPELLSKMSPTLLFPLIEKTVAFKKSSITYSKNKPHYTIKFPEQTDYSDVLAFHSNTLQFAMDGDPINSLRYLIIGSLMEGCYKKKISYTITKPIKELKFSPDGEKMVAIAENTVILFDLNENSSRHFSLETPIYSFCLNNEQIALCPTDNCIHFLFINPKGEIDLSRGHWIGRNKNNLHGCFGPNSEFMGISSFEGAHIIGSHSSETCKAATFEFSKEISPLTQIKQLFNVNKNEYIVISYENESDDLYQSVTITKRKSLE